MVVSKSILIKSLCLLISCALLSCSEKSVSEKYNVLFIAVDDLRPELNSFGVEYMQTPHIDALASRSISFLNHYVNAPSCGPSRYTLLMGTYGPADNQAIFKRAREINSGAQLGPSLPGWLRSKGYQTVSVGKVSHHPGGLGGENWNDTTLLEMPNSWDRYLMPVKEWETPRGAMHGLAHGEQRVVSKEMDVYQSTPGPDTIYPDGLITAEAVKQLKLLSADKSKPFFLVVGLLKPHLPFGSPEKYLEPYKNIALPSTPYPSKPKHRSTWHPSGEFNQYNLWGKDPNTDPEFAAAVRKHYAAAISYADAQVGEILAALKENGADKNTIVVLWGDHGWHLGEHGIWGKHSLFEESLRSPLVIHHPQMKTTGIKTLAMVETVDLFPTLCDLLGLQKPQGLAGVSLEDILKNPDQIGHPTLAYLAKASTLRTDRYRLVLHEDGYTELYDHQSAEKETLNLAPDEPELRDSLIQILNSKLIGRMNFD
ncbi:sulfatase [Algoriphagus namhaensis]